MPTEAARAPKRERSRASRIARSVGDGILAVAVLYMVYLIGSAALDSARRRTELRLLNNEAEALYQAFATYYERNHAYPSTYSDARFDPETLNPLYKRGYYRGSLTSLIRNHRVDAYDSPDDRGRNREFWVEMTYAADPSIRVLIARSDDAPIGGGAWREGVFLFRDGELQTH